MKRDMDLVAKLLLALEEQPGFWNLPAPEIEGYSEEEIHGHLWWLGDNGLLLGRQADPDAEDFGFPRFSIDRITWAGHEFLAVIHAPAVWSKVLAKIKEKAGALTFEMVKTLASQVAKEHMGL